jgi:outer membrane protein assembly factor BamA
MIRRALAVCLALIPSLATAQARGELATGISYSTLYGTTGNLSLRVSDAFGTGLDMSAAVRAGDAGAGGHLALRKRVDLAPGEIGAPRALDFALRVQGSDWSFRSFATGSLEASVTYRTRLQPATGLSLGVFGRVDRLNGVSAGTSAFIAADQGESTAAGLLGGLAWQAGANMGFWPHTARTRVSVDTAVALAGDRRWTSLSASVDHAVPLSPRLAMLISAEAGAMTGGGNGYVSVLDRAFLGDDMPRGFEYGGAGPRDTLTDTALGGTKYVVGSVEFVTPLRPGRAHLGVFADVGSVWDLPGIASATVDEQFFLRSSAGISLFWGSETATFRVSVAEPLRRRATDRTQTISVMLEAVF